MRAFANILLAILLLPSLSWADSPVSSSTIINFKKDPLRSVRLTAVSNSPQAEPRLYFESCYGSSCQAIKSPNGYSLKEIKKAHNKMRAKKWFHRLFTVPAGSVCTALLAGAAASVATSELFALGAELFSSGAYDFVAWPLELMTGNPEPAAKGFGFVELGAGVMVTAVSASIVAGYTIMGLALGLPATWVAKRMVFPNYSRNAKIYKHLKKNMESYDAPAELTFKGRYSDFVKALELALPKEL